MADIGSLSDLCVVRNYKKKSTLPFTHSTRDRKLGSQFTVPDEDRDLLIHALDNERTINLEEHLSGRFRFFLEILGTSPLSDAELRTFCGLASFTVGMFYPGKSDSTMFVLSTTEEGQEPSVVCRIIFPDIICEASSALRIHSAYKCVLHAQAHGEARRRITGCSFPNEESLLSPEWEASVPRRAYLHQTGHSVPHSQVFEKCPETGGCGERCQVCAGRKCIPKGRALVPRTVLTGREACFGSAESDLLVTLKNRQECLRRTLLRCSDKELTEGYAAPENAPYVPVKVTERKVELPETFREENKATAVGRHYTNIDNTKGVLCHKIRKAVEEFKVGDQMPFGNALFHITGIRRIGFVDMSQKHTYKITCGGFGSHSCLNYQGTHSEEQTDSGGRIHFVIDKTGIHQKCSCLTVPPNSCKPCNKYASKGQPLPRQLLQMLGYHRTSGNECFNDKLVNVYIPNLERIMNGESKTKKRKRTM